MNPTNKYSVSFSGGSYNYLGTGSTIYITLSASPVGNYHFADDGITNGTYDRQEFSGFTYWRTTTPAGQTVDQFTGTVTFYSGTTKLAYTEPGQINFNRTLKYINVGAAVGVADAGYFNILPN